MSTVAAETASPGDLLLDWGAGRDLTALEAAEECARTARELVVRGLLDVPGPGVGRTGQRFDVLRAVGRLDLGLARLVEGHVDAAAILHELGARGPVGDGLWGVWAADPPHPGQRHPHATPRRRRRRRPRSTYYAKHRKTSTPNSPVSPKPWSPVAASCNCGRPPRTYEEEKAVTSQTIAMWVSAIGSAGALLGFAGYVIMMQLNRKDTAEIRREEQAQGVAAWLDEGRHHDEQHDYVLCLHNAGTTPVFRCAAHLDLPTRPHRDDYSGDFYWHVVPPGTTAALPVPALDQSDTDDNTVYSAAAVPELGFTDSHGAHWHRDGNGVLHRRDHRLAWRRTQARQITGGHGTEKWERNGHGSSDTSTTGEALPRHPPGSQHSREQHSRER